MNFIGIKIFVRKFKTTLVSKYLSTEEKLYLLKQLHLLLREKVNIKDALSMMLYDLPRESTSARLFLHLYKKISSGYTVSQALSSFPNFSDSMLIFLSEIGQKNDSLSNMLKLYCDTKNKQVQMKQDLKKVLFYPSVLLITTFIIVGVLLIFVIPQFADMFLQMNVPLPWITNILLNISAFFKNSTAIISFIIISIIILKFATKRYDSLANIWRKIILKLPIFGSLVHLNKIVQICNILALLMEQGVGLLPSIKSVRYCMENKSLEMMFYSIEKQVSSGNSLSNAINQYEFFPPLFKQMVAKGENVNMLPHIFSTLAEIYEQQSTRKGQWILMVLEPIMISIIAIIIGIVVVAIYLPIFQLGLTIQ